jgi:hypothetical protein
VYSIGHKCYLALAEVLHALSIPKLTLTMENITADTFAHSHAQIDIQADSSYANASVAFVLG